MQNTVSPRLPLTRTQWLICVIATIGFAFDVYELLILPLVGPPAILALDPQQDTAHWIGLLFYVPAVCGGIFGLLGGYLTDLLGRRRVLTFSILLYAVSAVMAGLSNSMEMLLFWRCTTFIGVCVEFVAAVAWLAELFPNPEQRESVLGYTQAASSLGGIMAAGVWDLIQRYGDTFPAIFGAHDNWRYGLISGVFPAIPLILIRPFLPESPMWLQKSKAGTLRRPSILELFAPMYRRTTIVTTLMFACSYAVAFGAIQQLPQIVLGLPEVAEAAKSAMDNVKPTPDAAKTKALKARARSRAAQPFAARVGEVQEIGGLIGRVLLAFLAVRILSRRALLRVFQIPGLFVVPLVFLFLALYDITWLKFGIFFAGLFTVAQFSFWGNYLPRVYPTYLRGTGEGFAANIGGRMIGTSAALITVTIATHIASGPQPSPKDMAYTAAGVAFVATLIGVIASFWLPEPQQGELPE